MKNKLLTVIFCVLALVLLVGCEKKTTTKKQVNPETSQTQNGGSQTQGTQGSQSGQQTTTTQAAQGTVVVSLLPSDFGTAATAEISDYVQSKITKDGVGFYAHSIIRSSYLQVGVAKVKSGKTTRQPSVVMNTTAKKVVKIEFTIDASAQNFDGKVLVFGFNEAIADFEAFAAKGLTPVETITLVSGTTTYTYTFTGDYTFFAISPSDRFLALASLKVTFA